MKEKNQTSYKGHKEPKNSPQEKDNEKYNKKTQIDKLFPMSSRNNNMKKKNIMHTKTKHQINLGIRQLKPPQKSPTL